MSRVIFATLNSDATIGPSYLTPCNNSNIVHATDLFVYAADFKAPQLQQIDKANLTLISTVPLHAYTPQMELELPSHQMD